MVPTPYDPYNSPMDIRQDPCGEPQIILFPFSSAATPKISAVPRKIRVDSHPHNVDNLPPPSKNASSNDEIAELKRRLQEIKVKRARQRHRTLGQLPSQDELESYHNPKKDDATLASFHVETQSQLSRNQLAVPLQRPSLRNEPTRELEHDTFNASLPAPGDVDVESPSELVPLPLRRPSLKFETATGTLNTSFDSSSNGSIYNLKRLLCYKPMEDSKRGKNVQQNRRSVPATSSRVLSRDHDRERVMNVLDSLVCVRPGKGDPFDLIICNSPPTEDTIVTSSESLNTGYTSTFDPYCSTASFSSPRRSGKSDQGMGPRPTGGSSSIFVDYEPTDNLGLGDGGIANKSCTSSRRSPPAWYERPDSIDTSEIKQQVMEMVFYSNNPNEPFDCHSRLSESLLY